MTIEREIVWRTGALDVIDRFSVPVKSFMLRRLVPNTDIGTHSPSARLETVIPPDYVAVSEEDTHVWAERINRQETLCIRTCYSSDSRGRLHFRSISEES